MPHTPRILVIGSINVDLIVEASRMPSAGETIVGESSAIAAGGKGANAAVAAARLGAEAAFVGRVGDDTWGRYVHDTLRESGVNDGLVKTDAAHPTGAAFILVEPGGQNRIIAVPGANAALDFSDVDEALSHHRRFDAVMLQFEINIDTTLYAIERARRRGMATIIDAGPARKVPLDWLGDVTVLSPNQTEAAALSGVPIESPADAQRAADVLFTQTRAAHVVIKLGEAGAWLRDAEYDQLIEPFHVKAVDSTAAGDAFTAALAVQLCRGVPIADAVRYANAAGALACTALGAQPSLPTREAVEQLMDGGPPRRVAQ